jgi:hypothetical protein
MIHNNLKSVHETEFNDGYSTPEYITVHVTDAKNIEMDGKKVYTTYKVSTSVSLHPISFAIVQKMVIDSAQTTFPEYKQKEFAVRRRYKDFVWLRNHLRDRLNEKGKRLTLAELPGNTFSSFLGSGERTEPFHLFKSHRVLSDDDRGHRTIR